MRGRTKIVHAILVCAVGCSATSSSPAPSSTEPVGCCCSYGNCREGLTPSDCATIGEFQGWTYTWHAGPCTTTDTPLQQQK